MLNFVKSSMLTATILIHIIPIVTTYDLWKDVKLTEYREVGILVPIEYMNVNVSESSGTGILLEPLMSKYLIAVMVTRNFALTMGTTEYPLPSAEDVLKWMVIINIVNITKNSKFDLQTQARKVLGMTSMTMADSSSNTQYTVAMLNIEFIEHAYLREVLHEQLWPKELVEVCTVVSWDYHDDAMHKIAGHFYVQLAEECGLRATSITHLCISSVQAKFLCDVDPHPAIVICQKMLAGFYLRLSPNTTSCKTRKTSESTLPAVPIVNLTRLFPMITNVSCPAEHQVKIKAIDFSRLWKSKDKRESTIPGFIMYVPFFSAVAVAAATIITLSVLSNRDRVARATAEATKH